MAEIDHLTNHELQEFISGRAGPAASEVILAHLGQCDHCLALADEIWAQQPVGTAAFDMVELDPPTAQRVEKKVVNQIHLSNLGGTVFRLGTQGFLSVAAGLLSPLMRPRRRR